MNVQNHRIKSDSMSMVYLIKVKTGASFDKKNKKKKSPMPRWFSKITDLKLRNQCVFGEKNSVCFRCIFEKIRCVFGVFVIGEKNHRFEAS